MNEELIMLGIEYIQSLENAVIEAVSLDNQTYDDNTGRITLDVTYKLPGDEVKNDK